MIRSMTGFGAASVEDGALSVRAEARSVNHRFLQLKTRLPSELAHLEGELEGVVKKLVERGAVTIHVAVERAASASVAKLDEGVARVYRDQLQAMAKALGIAGDVKLETLVELPGVVASPDLRAEVEQEAKLVETAVRGALAKLVLMREVEGRSLLADMQKHTDGIRKLVLKIEERMPTVVVEHHAALQKRVDELLGGRDVVKKADIARELALLAERMDVSEELSRLASHLGQLDTLLAKEKPVGRELDFLVQEFLREANTVGAKCSDAAIAHAVVELKTLIERLREQVQNVE
ncbi:MAG: YicC family protein [Planctomycetes bacterium]|nr:YicC family protein [Planctomycetota bacterium]